jgi:hypothetical protein
MSAADAVCYSLLCYGLDVFLRFTWMCDALDVDCVQVLERANKSEYGLAAGIFSKDVDMINALSRCFICLPDCVSTLLSCVQPHIPVHVYGFLHSALFLLLDRLFAMSGVLARYVRSKERLCQDR